MTLDAATSRQPLHTRAIELNGYKRSDGLFEIEGRLKDTKPFDFQPPSGNKVVRAGEPVHDMAVRIVFDEDMKVHDILAVSDALPYDGCAGGPDTLKALIGLNMSRGWSSAVRERLSGAAGCVHLAGLMVPMAAAAFQALTRHRIEQLAASGQKMKPKVDSCLAYSRHGELVRRQWPTLWVAKTQDIE
jgi:hypothetical protein